MKWIDRFLLLCCLTVFTVVVLADVVAMWWSK